jgi:hypothetical protein
MSRSQTLPHPGNDAAASPLASPTAVVLRTDAGPQELGTGVILRDSKSNQYAGHEEFQLLKRRRKYAMVLVVALILVGGSAAAVVLALGRSDGGSTATPSPLPTPPPSTSPSPLSATMLAPPSPTPLSPPPFPPLSYTIETAVSVDATLLANRTPGVLASALVNASASATDASAAVSVEITQSQELTLPISANAAAAATALEASACAARIGCSVSMRGSSSRRQLQSTATVLVLLFTLFSDGVAHADTCKPIAVRRSALHASATSMYPPLHALLRGIRSRRRSR